MLSLETFQIFGVGVQFNHKNGASIHKKIIAVFIYLFVSLGVNELYESLSQFLLIQPLFRIKRTLI